MKSEPVLHLGTDVESGKPFELPLSSLALRFALLATSGSGKTNTAGVVAEGTLDAKEQLVVIDPQGDWWGIRASSDGKGEGYPVLVMGGPHGDVPLSPRAGELVADLVVDERLDVVLDTSEFSNADHQLFCMAFAEQLFHRKNTDTTPLLLICEEAESVAPQVLTEKGNEIRMLGIFSRIAKRGRRRGIFLMVISQRTADINKKFLSQCRALVALRTTWAPDVKVIDEWASGAVTDAKDPKRSLLKRELGNLLTGEAWIWIPELRIFRKVAVRLRKTFDAGATPEFGQEKREPKKLARVDIQRISQRIGALVEEKKESDPAVLKARIKELEREVSRREPPGVATIVEKVVEKPVVAESELTELVSAVMEAGRLAGHRVEVAIADAVRAAAESYRGSVRELAPSPPIVRRPAPSTPKPAPAAPSVPSGRPEAGPKSNGKDGRQKILDALAFLKLIGASPVSRNRLAFFADASPTSSTFGINLATLQREGLVVAPSKGLIELTPDGQDRAVIDGTVPRTTTELVDRICAKLKLSQVYLLRTLVDRHPNAESRAELARLVDVSPTSSSFGIDVAALADLGLVTYPVKGWVRASDDLFIGGGA